MTTPNDNDRFRSLLEGHKGILYKVANGYCRNRDERGDLIQEIVIQLWQSFPRYEESRSRFSTWMYRIAVNVAISTHRSASRRVRETIPIEDFGLELAAADKVMDEATDDVRLLRKLVGELDEMSRALVILYLDGYAHDLRRAGRRRAATARDAAGGTHRMTKWTILLGPLLWFPLFVVALEGFIGLDAYAAFDRTWILVNVLFGVAFIPAMLVVAKRLRDRFADSPLLERLLRDIAGRNLSAAQSFLDELARFESSDGT